MLGTETISGSGLAQGTHSGTSPAFQIPVNGSYYLFAKLNANNDFLESDSSNDTNNMAVTAQPVGVSGPVIVDNGGVGYSETRTWYTETRSGAYGGSDRYAASSGNGSTTATWQVSNLLSGSYTVQVAWPTWGNQPTNAPFKIYDGSTLIQTVYVDETKTPVGSTYGGVPFQTLLNVNITSGTLKVVVDNSGNGTWVIADAIRVAPA